MRVLFIYPNVLTGGFIHLGLASLSAELKSDNHETDLFDATFYNNMSRDLLFKNIKNIHIKNYDPEQILFDLCRKIDSFKPDIIAFTCTSNSYNRLLLFSQFLKHNCIVSRDIPIIVGGPKATIDYQNLVNEKDIDFVAVGECDKIFPEFINKLEDGKEFVSDNIISKENKKLKLSKLVSNLDDLKYPDYSIFNDEHFYRAMLGDIYKFGWVEYGRGCPYNCNYCISEYIHNLYNDNHLVRHKSVDRMIDELIYLKKTYSLEYLRFIDETFLNIPINIMKDFASKYIEKVELPFVVMTHPNTITKEKVSILKSMGCTHMSIGIESGNESLRNSICNRNISNERIVKAFRCLSNAGIGTTSFNIIGFPTETRQNIFDTIDLNRRSGAGVPSLSYLYPFEGTKLYDYCVEHEMLNPEDGVPEDYTNYSILKLDSISQTELHGIGKTFHLYCKYPKYIFPLIEIAERDDFIGNKLRTILNKYYRYKYAE